MAIKQLSVFVGNKAGSLSEAAELLAAQGIDLRAMSIADTSDYGIVRLIVDDPEKASQIFSDNGIISTVTEICAFAVPDVPGGLANALRILSDNEINIEYLYSLVTSKAGKAFAVMRVADNAAAEQVLTANGIEVATVQDIANI